MFSYGKSTYYNTILNETSFGNGYCVFGFGSGTTDATIEDFSLENVFADDVFTVETFGYNVDNSYNSQYVLTATYKYTGTDSIIISEIGLFTKLSIVQTAVVPNVASLMITREVLETPITVSNNDIFTVTMVLS